MPNITKKYNFQGMFNTYKTTLYCLYDYISLKAKIVEKKENTGNIKIQEYLFDQEFCGHIGASISHISHITIENGYKMNIELLNGSLEEKDITHELGHLKTTFINKMKMEKSYIIDYLNLIYNYFWITRQGKITDNYHGTLAAHLKSLELGLGINGFLKGKKITNPSLFNALEKNLDWLKNSNIFQASRYGTEGIQIPKLITVEEISNEKKKITKNIECLYFIKMILDNYSKYTQNPESYKSKIDNDANSKLETEIYLIKSQSPNVIYKKTQKDFF